MLLGWTDYHDKNMDIYRQTLAAAMILPVDGELENRTGSSTIKQTLIRLQVGSAGVNPDVAALNADRIMLGISIIEGKPGPAQLKTGVDALEAINNADLAIDIGKQAQQEIQAANKSDDENN